MAVGNYSTGIQEIPLPYLKPSKTNPRKTWDPAGLDKLAASIKSLGILEPILVRPIGTKVHRADGAPFVDSEIVAGERRWRAARLAGLSSIPCLVREMTDAQALETQIAENLEREDVHELEKAEGFQQLRERLKWTVEEISAKFGVSASEIYMTLKLLDLVPEGKKIFREGKISAAHAERIARLQPGDQKRTLRAVVSDQWIEGEEREVVLSVRDLSTFISREIVRDTAAAPWSKTDAELLKKAGPCSTCPKRAGNDPAMKELKATACTDGTCYDAKLEAFLLRKWKEAYAKSPGAIAVISGNEGKEYSRFPSVARIHEITPIEGKVKRCSNAVPVLWLDGQKAGTIGSACRNVDCKSHGRRRIDGYKPMSGAQLARRRAEILREKIQAETRTRTYLELGKRAEAGINLKTWRAIVGFLYEELVGDSRRPFLKAVGVNVSGDGVMEFSTMLARKIGSASSADLDRILVLLAAASSALRADYGVDRVKVLAKLLGVKTGKIAADVKAELSK